MFLCKYCEDIDPLAANWTTDAKNIDWRLRVDYDLQRPISMRLSAQNGCSGCRFFLDVLELEAADRRFVADSLRLDKHVFIKHAAGLEIVIGDRHMRNGRLNLCQVQGTVARFTSMRTRIS